MKGTRPRYFGTVQELRRWFAAHHTTASELWIGFYKRGKGPQEVGYEQALEEALCYGWIDTTVRRLDERRYAQRFAPRRPESVWSPANVERALRLLREERMSPAGRAAFEGRDRDRSLRSSQTREQVSLDPDLLQEFRAHAAAWDFFGAQSASYQRLFARWVMTARKGETRRTRLHRLISAAERKMRLDPLTLRPKA